MMKKELTDWNISATHFFTSCISIPLIVWTATSIFVLYFDIGETPTASVILIVTLYASIYFGVRYSALRMKKKYVINDASEIVKLSTKYLITSLGFVLVGITVATFAIATVPAFIAMTIAVVIFKFASTKYICQDLSTAEASPVGQAQESVSVPHEDGALR